MSALRCPSCGGPLDTSARKAAAWCPSCGEITAAGLQIAKLAAAEAESARLAALLTQTEQQRDHEARQKRETEEDLGEVRALLVETREALNWALSDGLDEAINDANGPELIAARALLARLTPPPACQCDGSGFVALLGGAIGACPVEDHP